MVIERREMIRLGLLLAGGLITGNECLAKSVQSDRFPVRSITKGPRFHWFGYYDKLQFDPSGRYVLGMEVGFEHRPPNGDDEIRIGMVDLKDNDRWIDLGSSKSWGWQQGCMLQWIPGSSEEIIWNDRMGDHYGSHILNVKTGRKRALSKAIYALSPDGSWAIGTEFSRIQKLRPGYGYAGVPDPYEDQKTPKEIGLYRLNLKTGEDNLLFNIADVASIPHNGVSVADNYHWFNHLLVNPDGTRFTFLDRWRAQKMDPQKMAAGGFVTRMFTASAKGDDLYCIDPSGFTSHFIWKDQSHITAYTKPSGQPEGFYILEDKTGKYERIGAGQMPVNGHHTYLPQGNGKEWILCDNYANAKSRLQTPYLYHLPTDKRIDLGSFNSPLEYAGEWRCDLHPRFSPNGKMVCIDSPHGGNGRQLYLIDIKIL